MMAKKETAVERFERDRYTIVNDDSGHDYVIPMCRRVEWNHWLGSKAWEAGDAPHYAMRIEGTLTFKEPTIVYS